MTEQDLKNRLKAFTIGVTKVCSKLPPTVTNKIYTGQLIRAASSSCANYRSACRGKSKKDFVYKLGIVEEELDESGFFLEMILEMNYELQTDISPLIREDNELIAIIVASIRTARANPNGIRPTADFN